MPKCQMVKEQSIIARKKKVQELYGPDLSWVEEKQPVLCLAKCSMRNTCTFPKSARNSRRTFENNKAGDCKYEFEDVKHCLVLVNWKCIGKEYKTEW